MFVVALDGVNIEEAIKAAAAARAAKKEEKKEDGESGRARLGALFGKSFSNSTYLVFIL